jgi:hypothetical protein
MRQLSLSLRAVLAAALCVTSLAAGAQTAGARAGDDDSSVPPAVADKQRAEIAKGDPARWTTGDNSTEARLKTLKKEIGAAYAQAKIECGKMSKAERADCLKEARRIYEHDMAAAPQMAKGGAVAEVVTQEYTQTKVVTRNPAPSPQQ